MTTSFEQLARMSVISGVVSLRNYIKKFPDLDKEAAIESLKTSYLYTNYDFEGALRIDEFLPEISLEEGAQSYQFILSSLINHTKPVWVAKAVSGRDAIKASLDPNQIQCFTAAGLFDSDPSDEATKWWDRLASQARSAHDQYLTELGRDGEKLSFEFEKKRVQSLDINAKVKWVAMDDQSLGYDILSATPAGKARLIEVKACQSLPLRFYLTRHEWKTAADCVSEFVFHIWHLPTQKLTEISVETVLKHIPIDQGGGNWDKVQITLT